MGSLRLPFLVWSRIKELENFFFSLSHDLSYLLVKN